MKLLAIDASGQVASVALSEDGKILAEYSVDFKKTHSQTLLPMVDEILRMTETKCADIGGIAVSKGPGSFTGLRIGGATAKGLCNALKVPVAGISTLEMLAANYLGSAELIVPLMDARRDQVYTAAYRVEDGNPVPVISECACAVSEIAERLNKLNEPVVLLGDGVAVNRQYLEGTLKCPYRFAPAHMLMQRAGSLAVLGETAFKDGKTQSGTELELEYLRLSQAERERMEREKTNDNVNPDGGEN